MLASTPKAAATELAHEQKETSQTAELAGPTLAASGTLVRDEPEVSVLFPALATFISRRLHRHCLALLELSNRTLWVWTYNWKPDLLKLLVSQLTDLVAWQLTRQRLHQSLSLQTMGLFYHGPNLTAAPNQYAFTGGADSTGMTARGELPYKPARYPIRRASCSPQPSLIKATPAQVASSGFGYGPARRLELLEASEVDRSKDHQRYGKLGSSRRLALQSSGMSTAQKSFKVELLREFALHRAPRLLRKQVGGVTAGLFPPPSSMKDSRRGRKTLPAMRTGSSAAGAISEKGVRSYSAPLTTLGVTGPLALRGQQLGLNSARHVGMQAVTEGNGHAIQLPPLTSRNTNSINANKPFPRKGFASSARESRRNQGQQSTSLTSWRHALGKARVANFDELLRGLFLKWEHVGQLVPPGKKWPSALSTQAKQVESLLEEEVTRLEKVQREAEVILRWCNFFLVPASKPFPVTFVTEVLGWAKLLYFRVDSMLCCRNGRTGELWDDPAKPDSAMMPLYCVPAVAYAQARAEHAPWILSVYEVLQKALRTYAQYLEKECELRVLAEQGSAEEKQTVKALLGLWDKDFVPGHASTKNNPVIGTLCDSNGHFSLINCGHPHLQFISSLFPSSVSATSSVLSTSSGSSSVPLIALPPLQYLLARRMGSGATLIVRLQIVDAVFRVDLMLCHMPNLSILLWDQRPSAIAALPEKIRAGIQKSVTESRDFKSDRNQSRENMSVFTKGTVLKWSDVVDRLKLDAFLYDFHVAAVARQLSPDFGPIDPRAIYFPLEHTLCAVVQRWPGQAPPCFARNRIVTKHKSCPVYFLEDDPSQFWRYLLKNGPRYGFGVVSGGPNQLLGVCMAKETENQSIFCPYIQQHQDQSEHQQNDYKIGIEVGVGAAMLLPHVAMPKDVRPLIISNSTAVHLFLVRLDIDSKLSLEESTGCAKSQQKPAQEAADGERDGQLYKEPMLPLQIFGVRADTQHKFPLSSCHPADGTAAMEQLLQQWLRLGEKRLEEVLEKAVVDYHLHKLWDRVVNTPAQGQGPREVEMSTQDWEAFLNLSYRRPLSIIDRSLSDLTYIGLLAAHHNLLVELKDIYQDHCVTFSQGTVDHMLIFEPSHPNFLINIQCRPQPVITEEEGRARKKSPRISYYLFRRDLELNTDLLSEFQTTRASGLHGAHEYQDWSASLQSASHTSTAGTEAEEMLTSDRALSNPVEQNMVAQLVNNICQCVWFHLALTPLELSS
eukprot:gb/GEZN01000546.1/.p1 GENE.gb/GEZN01000546.1/~~gb/GEZN01000546.1/.p1  ORF type:complete len:1311 (-),score=158.35 gb/GEZN01000546.1/:258-3962(-)